MFNTGDLRDRTPKGIENTVEKQESDMTPSLEGLNPRKKTPIEEIWENQFKLMEERASLKENKEPTITEILESQGL